MFTGDQARLVAQCLPEEDQKGDVIDEVYEGDIGQKLWEDIRDVIRSVKNEAETT